jgi:hypothetical protein
MAETLLHRRTAPLKLIVRLNGPPARAQRRRIAKLVGCSVHYIARDARILDYGVAVSEASPLLLLLLWSKNNVLCELKQVLKMFRHGPPDTDDTHPSKIAKGGAASVGTVEKMGQPPA